MSRFGNGCMSSYVIMSVQPLLSSLSGIKQYVPDAVHNCPEKKGSKKTNKKQEK